jgi:hypothetical protein
MTEFLISLPTLAARMELDEPSLLRWIRDGLCPSPILAGGCVRFDCDVLASWRAAGCPACEPPTGADMRRIRVALVAEADERFQAAGRRFDAEFATASPAALARFDELCNSQF